MDAADADFGPLRRSSQANDQLFPREPPRTRTPARPSVPSSIQSSPRHRMALLEGRRGRARALVRDLRALARPTTSTAWRPSRYLVFRGAFAPLSTDTSASLEIRGFVGQVRRSSRTPMRI